ncbi:MAG: hypothetical protein IJQ90_02945 [Alphaproteobacteria bacterium]|nr:hypothetical protein [Alphaproteobacteria bacterium]
MQYSYPEIRDQIMIYAEDISVGRHHHDLGRCTIVPRGKNNEQSIKNFLAQNKIEYHKESGGYSMTMDEDVDSFVFQMGQNSAIDTTIQEMAGDETRLRNVNNRILRTARYNIGADFERGAAEIDRKGALEDLKHMVIKTAMAQYDGDTKPSHYYFFLRDPNVYNIEHAKVMLKQLGVRGVEEHFSEASGQTVLRLPMANVDGNAQNIITELQRAIATRGMSPLQNNIPGHPRM